MKLVNESLLEFQKGMDPVDSLFGNIRLGDLVTDRHILSDLSKWIYVVKDLDENRNQAIVATVFILYFDVEQIYIERGTHNANVDLKNLRKINQKEKDLLLKNWDLISKDITKFEKEINYKNNKNIKIRI